MRDYLNSLPPRPKPRAPISILSRHSLYSPQSLSKPAGTRCWLCNHKYLAGKRQAVFSRFCRECSQTCVKFSFAVLVAILRQKKPPIIDITLRDFFKSGVCRGKCNRARHDGLSANGNSDAYAYCENAGNDKLNNSVCTVIRNRGILTLDKKRPRRAARNLIKRFYETYLDKRWSSFIMAKIDAITASACTSADGNRLLEGCYAGSL